MVSITTLSKVEFEKVVEYSDVEKGKFEDL